jgi:hypothetical protein
MIGEPPVKVGGVQLTVTSPFPGVTSPIVGASGEPAAANTAIAAVLTIVRTAGICARGLDIPGESPRIAVAESNDITIY